MANEITVWSAVKDTGNVLSTITNFTTSVGGLISTYRASKQIDKARIAKLNIQTEKVIQIMKDEADYEVMANRMELIQKALEKAAMAPDSLSKQLSMDYVAKLHKKFLEDYR